jgi:hypothetical protein
LKLAKLYVFRRLSSSNQVIVVVYTNTLGLEYVVASASKTEHGSKVSDDLFWLFVGEEMASTFLLTLENDWTESPSPGPGNDSEFL